MVEGFREFDKLANRLGIRKALLQILQLRLDLSLSAIFLEGLDVFSAGDRENVEFVIENEAIVTRAERQDEPLVEPSNNSVMC